MSKTLKASNITDYFNSKSKSLDENDKMSPIDKKREEKDVTSKIEKPKKTNTSNFIKGILTTLISSILFLYLGASITGLSKYYIFNKMGGMDINSPPYSNKSTPMSSSTFESKIGGKRKNQRGGSSDWQSIFMDTYETLFGLNKWSWPYKNSNQGIFGDITNWMTNAMAHSFSQGRTFLYMIFHFIGKFIYGNKCSSDENCSPDGISGNFIELLGLVLLPFLFSAIGSGIIFFTIITVSFNMISNIDKFLFEFPLIADFVGDEWSKGISFLIGLFFFVSWIWIFLVSNGIGLTIMTTYICQITLFALFLLFVPLLTKSIRNNIKNIFINKLPILLACVFWILSPSAFNDIGKTGGWVVTGIALGFTLISILLLVSGNK